MSTARVLIALVVCWMALASCTYAADSSTSSRKLLVNRQLQQKTSANSRENRITQSMGAAHAAISAAVASNGKTTADASSQGVAYARMTTQGATQPSDFDDERTFDLFEWDGDGDYDKSA